MADLPGVVSYGTVTGTFIRAVGDGDDSNDLPDALPVAGTVTFTCSARKIIAAGKIIIPEPVVVTLDGAGAFTVKLIATDDTDLNPTGFTWAVATSFGLDGFSMALPAGSTVDLSAAVPVGSSGGTLIVKGDKGDPGGTYTTEQYQTVVGDYLKSINVLNLTSKLAIYGEARVSDFDKTRNSMANTGSTADHTASLQDALDAAATKGVPTVNDPFTFAVTGITVEETILGPSGGTTARFTDLPGYGTMKVRPVGAFVNNPMTGTLITVLGGGGGLRNIVASGQGMPGTLIEWDGFEQYGNNVRALSGTGVGMDFSRVQNAKFQFLYVDNCGSSTKPGARIWSKRGGAQTTNNAQFQQLRIERCANVGLVIGRGPDVADGGTAVTDSTYNWAEFVTLEQLHIEAPVDGPGANASPLLQIHNVRSLDIQPTLIYSYAGTPPLVSYDQQADRSAVPGAYGVKIDGGMLFGNSSTPYLVDLINGNDFHIDSLLQSYTTAAVRAQSTFGSALTIGHRAAASSARKSALPVLEENRTTRTPVPQIGDFELRGKLSSRQTTAPVFTKPAAYASGSLATGSTDVSGIVNTTVGGAAVAADTVVCSFTFNRAYPSQPVPTISPMNSVTAGAGLYVGTSSTVCTVYTKAGIAASSVLQFGYQIIGRP